MTRAARILALSLAFVMFVPLIPSVHQSFGASESPDAGIPPPRETALPRNPAGGYFIENAGQVEPSVRYYLRGNPAVAFRDDGLMFVSANAADVDGAVAGMSAQRRAGFFPNPHEVRFVSYFLRFENAAAVSPIGVNRLAFSNNFFIGNDRSEWATDVPAFGGVVYHSLYDGIDLSFYPDSGGVKYEFIVSPGADPRVIRMTYEGVESLRNDEAGLVVETVNGASRDSAPLSYQSDGALVDCGFVLRSTFSYGFDCPRWDRTQPLVIDPLIYSTYLGGGGWDHGYSISVDGSGSAYVTGWTYSPDFPVTPGAFNSTLRGTGDAFVTKLNPAGSALVYSTYLGGSSDDIGLSISVDTIGQAYVSGVTSSPDFPVIKAYDAIYNGNSDIYVAKLGVAGNALQFSTYFGGSENDTWPTVAVGPSGYVFISGITESPDFQLTPGAFDTSFNGVTDAFVLKLDDSGTRLNYSTFIGGADQDFAYSVTSDLAGNAYVTGGTTSLDFPTTPGVLATSISGNVDLFVTKVNANGTALDYSTYVGGSDDDYGLSIAADSAHSVYITGATKSSDFPTTPGAFDRSLNSPGNYDAFALKLDDAGSSLVYSTYLGGADYDFGNAVALDALRNAYVVGGTASADFPTTASAFQSTYRGAGDAFVTKLNETGALANSTYLGGSGSEHDFPFIALDDSAAIYITGITNSSDFPITPGAFDTTLNPNRDAFVTKLRFGGILRSFRIPMSPGHHLISFPLRPLNDSIDNVLPSASGCYDYLRWYDVRDATDHWKSYMPFRTFNDLDHLDNTMGFWINATASCDLMVFGLQSDFTSIRLHPGWNMVGFPSNRTSYTVADLKADLGLGGVRVDAPDSTAAPYYLQSAPDTYAMRAGEGYWIYVPSDVTWTMEW